MLFFYNIIISLIYRITWLAKKSAAQKGHLFWQGRLGLIKTHKAEIWIHAASVGEIKVVGELIRLLSLQRADLRIHLTAMTQTGFTAAKELYPHIASSFFPFDHKKAIISTLDAISPAMILIAETEIWPNLILEADKRAIPVVLVNGRMSDKSFKRYRLMKKGLRTLLYKYDHLFVKTETDKANFTHFQTAPPLPVTVAGDMKFDSPLICLSSEEKLKLHDQYSLIPNEPLFVAGSTRPGEEELLLTVYRDIKKEFPELRLILAPRHLDRVTEVEQLITNYHLTYRLLSQNDKSADVIVVDSMGLLNNLYALAEIAFVGGTLVPVGGHNLLEPVWCGTPVCYGPYTENVFQQAAYITEHNFGTDVKNTDELITLLKKYLKGDILFARKTATTASASATQKIVDYIRKKLPNA